MTGGLSWQDEGAESEGRGDLYDKAGRVPSALPGACLEGETAVF